MPKLIDLIGKSIGDWTVLSYVGSTPSRDHLWLCRCTCGKIKHVSGRNLRNGGSLGCGCTKKGLRGLPYQALYHAFLLQTRDRHFVSLTYDQFVGFTKTRTCHYCDAPVEWARFNISKYGSNYNLDRKDSSVGYIEQNLVVCCASCNHRKSHYFTYEQFVQIGNLIRSWR
jgi:hypothetical protein